MTDWNDVALVLKGWLDEERRLRVVIRSARIDGSFLCRLRSVDVDDWAVAFFVEGLVSGPLTCDLDGCFFEFKDVPKDVRSEPKREESAVFIVGNNLEIVVALLEDAIDND